MSDLSESVRQQLLVQAQAVLALVDEDGGHGQNVEDLIAAAEAGDELASAVVQALSPQLAVAWQSDHEHTWVKVDEVHQGLTQIRTYECRGCLAHTTLTGPMGIRSPFEVEENTDG